MSTGFRSQSSRAWSTWMLSGLNPVDTDWSAFNYYRSKLHSQPNQLCYSILLTKSTSLAAVLLEQGQLRWSAVLAASQQTFNTGGWGHSWIQGACSTKSYRRIQGLPSLRWVMNCSRSEWIGCHINDVMARLIMGAHAPLPRELPTGASMGFRCTPGHFPPAYLQILQPTRSAGHGLWDLGAAFRCTLPW